MNKKERELLKQQSLREAGSSEGQLLDFLFSSSLTRQDWYLAKYHTATAREQRKIVVSLSHWACTKKWAWDILVELCHHEPITPILKDTFVSPVLREGRKPPEETHGRGRKPNDVKEINDPNRDFNILVAVRVLTKYYYYTVEDALIAIAKKVTLSHYRTKNIYQKVKRERPFSKSKKRTSPQK